jgi:hypothetical protein
MARASFQLIGLASFVKDIDVYPSAIRTKLEAVTARAAHRLAAHAQALAPRREGDLANAIEAQGRGSKWRVGLVDRDIPARGGRNSAHRNPSVYGVWYEYGFVTRKIKKHPFMGQASEAAGAAYEAECERVVAGVG